MARLPEGQNVQQKRPGRGYNFARPAATWMMNAAAKNG
jgi:hypothetical protein